MSRYINPFTDFGFKKLFGSEPNKDLLIDFLNEVALPAERKITDLQYKPTEHLPKTEFERKAIFDLYCIGFNNERFIVEMQKAEQDYFKDRSVYYASFPIREQAKRGKNPDLGNKPWDFKLSEIYTVGILDFVFDEDATSQKVRNEVKLKDQDCNIFYDKLTFIYLEMPNFKKTEEELETNYDKWLYVLKHLSELEKRPRNLQERIFKRLFEVAEIAKFTPAEREQYDESEKTYLDLRNVMDAKFRKGQRVGKKEGKIEVVFESWQEGLSIETTAKITKLSIQEVRTLFEKFQKEKNS